MNNNISRANGEHSGEKKDVAKKLRMENITKKFPGVIANDAIDLEINTGEIHALLGENGAGKSTLMKVLYGLYTQDEGQIYIKDEPVNIDSPQDAIDNGIAMVHQHFKLISRLTPVENVVLGARETSYHDDSIRGRLSEFSPFESLFSGLSMNLSEPRVEIEELVDSYGMDLDLDKQIWELGVGQQQRVEILKALYRDAEILILDEPTAVLSPEESKELFKTLDKLKRQGISIIVITHKLHEVIDNADRTTVLREGAVVDSVELDTVDESDLAEMMVGREVLFQLDRETREIGEEVVNVMGLSAEDERNIQAINEIDLAVNQGEIVGVAGVSGNGQLELAQCLAGLREPTDGQISINGVDLTNESPKSFVEAGVSYIPEDRYEVGAAPDRSIINNAIMKNYREFANSTSFDKTGAREYAEHIVNEFDVRAPNVDTPVNKLSGGNLQKLICGREFSCDPEFLIANQPTRGIDVGAIEYIRQVLLEQRRAGTGILLISEDLDEIFQLSDRVVAIYDGEIVHKTDTEDTTREEIGQYIIGATVSNTETSEPTVSEDKTNKPTGISQ